MSQDKYMVRVVTDYKEFQKELNEAAADRWELHSFQVTPGTGGREIVIVLERRLRGGARFGR